MPISFQNKRMREIIILGIVVIVIALFGLISFNYYLSKEITELKARLQTPSQEVETPPEVQKVSLPKILYNLAGEIKKLDKNSFTLEATVPQLTENGEITQKIESRKVITTPDTKFSRLTFVVQEGTNRKTPQETSITFKDLRVGDYIEVISNQDISEKQEFEVTQVRILPKSF